MTAPQPKRRAGAKAIDGAQNVQRVTITLEEDDRKKLRKLGGSPWVRRQIRLCSASPYQESDPS